MDRLTKSYEVILVEDCGLGCNYKIKDVIKIIQKVIFLKDKKILVVRVYIFYVSHRVY